MRGPLVRWSSERHYRLVHGPDICRLSRTVLSSSSAARRLSPLVIDSIPKCNGLNVNILRAVNILRLPYEIEDNVIET
jgi:hypothetical protein